ncbi:MAG: SPOR domain-containing protein, partial [Desulfosudaceae bacterium]
GAGDHVTQPMAKNKKKTGDNKRFYIALSAREGAGWLTLLLLICGWFFVLGILVGRWHVPVPENDGSIREELTAAREQALSDPSATATGSVPAAPVEPAEEVAGTPPAEAAETAPAPAAAEVAELKDPVARKTESAPEPVDEPAEEAAPPEAVFTIQVAALKDEQTARRLMAKLKKKEFPAYVRQARLEDGSVWFRIRCGEFAERPAAEPVMTALRKEGYSPLLVKQ